MSRYLAPAGEETLFFVTPNSEVCGRHQQRSTIKPLYDDGVIKCARLGSYNQAFYSRLLSSHYIDDDRETHKEPVSPGDDNFMLSRGQSHTGVDEEPSQTACMANKAWTCVALITRDRKSNFSTPVLY